MARVVRDLSELAEHLGLSEKRHSISTEVILMRLREAFPRFLRDNPYVPGDVVTSYADSPHIGAGEPMIVIAVRTADYDFAVSEPGNNLHGGRLDTRVIQFESEGVEGIISVWTDSANLRFYEEV